MSFGRAKLLRFNEFIGCAPPPGTYRTQKVEKTKYGSFDKSERFTGDRQCRTPRLPLRGGHSARSHYSSDGEGHSLIQDGGDDVLRIRAGDETSEHDQDKSRGQLAEESDPESQFPASQTCPQCNRQLVIDLKRKLNLIDVMDKATVLKEKVMNIATKQEDVLKIQRAITEDISQYSEKVAELQKTKSELTQCKNDMGLLEKTVLDLTQYKERVIVLENVSACLVEYEERIALLEKTNAELNEKAAKLQNENIDYRVSISELTNEIDEITASRDVIYAKHHNLRREMKEKFIHIRSLTATMKRLEDSLADEIKKNEALGEDNMGLLEKVSTMNADDHERKSEVVALRSELEITKKDVEECNFARLDLVNKISELKDQFSEEVNNLVNLHSEEKRGLMENVESAQSELKIYKHEIMRIDGELSVALAEKKNLGDRCNELEHTLEKEQNAVSSQIDSLQQALQACDIATYVNPYSNGEQDSDSPGRELNGHSNSLYYDNNSSHDSKLTWMTELCAVLAGKLKEFKETIRKLESEREENVRTIQNLEGLIGPFRNQLEDYEQERLKYQTMAKQTKEEFEKLALSQAAMLGHQNSKQKIKHLVQLKHTNLKLQDVVKDLNDKLKQKERTISKLTSEGKHAEKPSPRGLKISRKENSS